MKKKLIVTALIIITLLIITGSLFIIKKENDTKKDLKEKVAEEKQLEEEKEEMIWYEIPELRIRIELTKKIANSLVYSYQKRNHKDKELEYVSFTMKELVQFDATHTNEKYCSVENGPLGSLTKYKNESIEIESGFCHNPYILGEYTICYSSAQSPCADGKLNDLQSEGIKSIETSLKQNLR